MSLYVCQLCLKSFKSQRALQGHSRIHGPSKGRTNQIKVVHPDTGKLISKKHFEQYTQSLKRCQRCNIKFKPSNNSLGLYCSQSCRAKVVNSTRMFSESVETRKQENKKARVERARAKRQNNKGITVQNTCKHCGDQFISLRRQKYCNAHSNLYANENRNKYAFAFNIYKYPKLFDLEHLETVGFYNPITNKMGLTRDHKVSVNEAILNDYDPYYITHPLNCELMSFTQNNKKKTTSSITYEELVSLVDTFRNQL